MRLLSGSFCSMVFSFLAFQSGRGSVVVEYELLGSFNGGAAVLNPSFTFGTGPDTATIEYAGISLTSVGAPTVLPYGAFRSFATGLGASVPAGTTFTFFLHQSLPAEDLEVNTGTVTGFVDSASSTANITFSSSSYTLSGNISWLQSSPIGIVSPSSGWGTTQGLITGIPEPTTWMMLLTGMFGLSIYAGSRRMSAGYSAQKALLDRPTSTVA